MCGLIGIFGLIGISVGRIRYNGICVGRIRYNGICVSRIRYNGICVGRIRYNGICIGRIGVNGIGLLGSFHGRGLFHSFGCGLLVFANLVAAGCNSHHEHKCQGYQNKRFEKSFHVSPSKK